MDADKPNPKLIHSVYVTVPSSGKIFVLSSNSPEIWLYLNTYTLPHSVPHTSSEYAGTNIYELSSFIRAFAPNNIPDVDISSICNSFQIVPDEFVSNLYTYTAESPLSHT